MQNVELTILSQYANSPIINRLIYNMNQYIDPSTNITNFYNDVFNIETAQGYGLDLWGRILGVTRVLFINSITYFGFTGPSGASGAPFNQGVFYNNENLNSNFSLADAQYRTLLFAKALFNITACTTPAINQILINLFGPVGLIPVGATAPYVADGANMTLTYTFSTVLDPVSYAIVYQSGVLPRPTGVNALVAV